MRGIGKESVTGDLKTRAARKEIQSAKLQYHAAPLPPAIVVDRPDEPVIHHHQYRHHLLLQQPVDLTLHLTAELKVSLPSA